MIQSMTGYGKSVIHLPSKTVTIEIQSLNSKGLDIYTRIPPSFKEKELEIRDLLAKSLIRGKIDFYLSVEITGEATTTQVNEMIVKHYIRQLANVVNGDPIELLKMAVRMPDALKAEKEQLDDDEYSSLLKGIQDAVKAIQNFRADEGAVLQKDFTIRVENIKSLLVQVETMDEDRIEMVRERLQRAVEKLKESYDENRFEQELVYYLEKFDITEEKVRLKTHLDYFEETLNTSDSGGKKLGFIIQEMGREINTMGSKANNAPLQQLVVQMKDELEKMKEQALNIL